MKVRDLIIQLENCNPNADVSLLVGTQPYPFVVCQGGGDAGDAQVVFYVSDL